MNRLEEWNTWSQKSSSLIAAFLGVKKWNAFFGVAVRKGTNRPEQYSQHRVNGWVWELKERNILKVTMISGLHSTHSSNTWGSSVCYTLSHWEQSGWQDRQGMLSRDGIPRRQEHWTRQDEAEIETVNRSREIKRSGLMGIPDDFDFGS